MEKESVELLQEGEEERRKEVEKIEGPRRERWRERFFFVSFDIIIVECLKVRYIYKERDGDEGEVEDKGTAAAAAVSEGGGLFFCAVWRMFRIERNRSHGLQVFSW